MKIKFPEPVGREEVFYEKTIVKKMLQPKELEKILSEAEKRIIFGCDELKTGKYVIADYCATFMDNNDKVIGELLMGGYYSQDSIIENTDSLKKRYLACFGKFRRLYLKPARITAKINLTAWRDSITKVVEAGK